jgi:hypothetical protein
MKKAGRRCAPPSQLLGFLGFAQDAIDRGVAYRALALSHTTTRVRDVHRSFELALLLALNAISLTLICLSHSFLRSSQVLLPANTLNHTPGPRSNPRNSRSLSAFPRLYSAKFRQNGQSPEKSRAIRRNQGQPGAD